MMRNLLNCFKGFAVAAALTAGGFTTFSASAETLYPGYGVSPNSSYEVYPYSGFVVNEDVKDVTVAVKLGADKLSAMEGGKITKLYIGWSGVYQQFTPTATAFVRNGLNEANTTEQAVALTAGNGWNEVTFATPYVIKPNDELFVGYTVDMKGGVYGPCTLMYGNMPEGTHFISRPDVLNDKGEVDWIDLATPGLMDITAPVIILTVVELDGATVTSRAEIIDAITPSILKAGEASTGALKIQNNGSQAIEKFTVTYSQEGQTPWSRELELSEPLNVTQTTTVSIPVYAEGKGEVTLTISKVNGEDNTQDSEYKFTPIVLGDEVYSKYTRRPLMEYFASESEYHSEDYNVNIVTPALEPYASRYSRINWHYDDQFQLGLADDKDLALDLAIEMVKKDLTKVSFPNVMIDRSNNLGLSARLCFTIVTTPMLSVLYSPAAESTYEYALDQPTYGKVDAKFNVEGTKATVEVSGEIDTAVLPDGEQPVVTVVLIEDGIATDSQEFPGGDGGSSNPGNCIHNAMVRHCLTDIMGDKLTVNNGKFEASYTTELDFDNVPANMRAVAFIHRPMTNGMWGRSVINSTEVAPEIASISEIAAAQGESMSVYNLAGVKVPATSLTPGIYVVKITSEGKTSTFKTLVK